MRSDRSVVYRRWDSEERDECMATVIPGFTELGSVKVFHSRNKTNLYFVILSHTRTVVRECCKGDDESQWERGKFDPPATHKPLNRWSPKFVQVTTSGISTTMQNFIQIGLGVSVLRMRDFAPLVTRLLFTARCYASAVLAMALCLSVRPSVRPSQVGVLLKRLHVGSHKQHHTILQGI